MIDHDLLDLLRQSLPFSKLPADVFTPLMAKVWEEGATTGEIIFSREDAGDDYLVLLQGAMQVTRQPDAQPSSGEVVRSGGTPIILSPSMHQATVTALETSRYLRIDGDVIDRLLSCSPQFLSRLGADAALLSRLCLISSARPFRKLPSDKLEVALDHMTRREVVAGEAVLTQGEKFDYFYLLDSGAAEVWRTDPMTDETACVDTIGPGDTFGEEALIMSGFRNATIRMLTPGSLWRLDQTKFNDLLRVALIEEVSPEEAKGMVDKGEAVWLDCRYDLEFADAHIPGAQWVPLDRIRHLLGELDASRQYVVYCRSGRRSASAAFLLRERGYKALSLAGGVKDWPYELAPSEDGPE